MIISEVETFEVVHSSKVGDGGELVIGCSETPQLRTTGREVGRNDSEFVTTH